MSLTDNIKKEIIAKEIEGDCCNGAFMSAVIRTCGSLVVGGGGIAVEIACRVGAADMERAARNFAGRLYGAEVAAHKRGVKTNVRISGERTEEMLRDLGVLDAERRVIGGIDKYLVMGACCIAAYARGAFFGAGVFYMPKTGGYHLRFLVSSRELAGGLAGLLAQIDIMSKIIPQDIYWRLYIKDSQNISDLLALIGADKAVLLLHGNIAERDVSKAVNRDNNCFLANLSKTVEASVLQRDAVSKLMEDGRIDALPHGYAELAALRLANPEMSYQELADKTGQSKSAVKYKLDRIVNEANER